MPLAQNSRENSVTLLRMVLNLMSILSRQSKLSRRNVEVHIGYVDVSWGSETNGNVDRDFKIFERLF